MASTDKRFDKMGKRADKFGRKSKRSFNMASKAATSFKSVMGGVIGANVLTRGTQLLTQGIGTATREFVDFDQALTVASAKFPSKIKRGTEAFKELQDAARKVGADTQFTATQSAEGLALFAAAGIDAKVSMAALNGVVDLATATSVEFAEATQASLDTMGQFGLKAKDAAKFASNLDRVSDSLVFTVNSASLQMEDLTETLKFVGPIANTAGAEIEEVNAIIAAMAESGIRGSLAGTAMKNMYLRLLEPTPKIRKELRKLKINLEDDNGEMRKMTDIIAQMEKSMGGMTKKQKTTSMAILFGKRAVAGASAAMETGSEKIAKFEEEMRKAGGTSKNTADDIRKGLGNQLKILQSTAIEAGFRLIEDFAGDGEKGIQGLIETIRKFDMKPVAAGIRDAIETVKSMAKWVWKNRDALKALATGALAVGGTIAAIQGITTAIGAAQTLIAMGPYGPLLIALGLATAAAVKLNSQMTKNIELQDKLASANQLTKNRKEALTLTRELNAVDDRQVQQSINARKRLIFAFQKIKKNQNNVGESTTKTEEKIRSLRAEIELMNGALISTSRAIMFEGLGAGMQDANTLAPSVFTGQGLAPEAPNAAAVDGKNSRSQLDVN
ncbi:MAG: phage tail tape measure protein, partial [Planctomycetota bacterium]